MAKIWPIGDRVIPPAPSPQHAIPDNPAAAPFFVLPGFLPDALPFALRTTLSLLLAYYVAFAIQLEAASTAGICVAIVAQPSPGMAAAKATYRLAGTLVGGAVALALLSAFPQDRVMLLAGFALWLAICTFVATLLRDFRSYGAALSGYTAGIIAIGIIDAPGNALITTLNRVAAIVIGIGAVLLVNIVFAGPGALTALIADLTARVAAMRALALDALEGRGVGDDLASIRVAAGAAALQSQAIFAAKEVPSGGARGHGARHAIAALLAMVSAGRAVAATLGPDTPRVVRAHLADLAASIRDPSAPPTPPPPRATTPADALLIERAEELAARSRDAGAALRLLTDGDGVLPPVRLRPSYDVVAALLGAARALIGVGLGSVFCIYAGWGGATLVLIQQAAFTALLASSPNPSAASLAFAAPLLPVALLVGAMEFLLLPGTSGFVPFALAVAPLAIMAGLVARQPALAPYAPATFIYVPLLLSPANPQTYDLSTYCNTVLQLGLATLFTLLSFDLILRVSPTRRLYRVASAIAADLRRTLRRDDRLLDQAPAQSVLYDRMARALTWLGRPTPGRLRLLHDIYGIGEADLAMRRARTGLALAEQADPACAAAAAQCRRSLRSRDPAQMLEAAQFLLDYPAAPAAEGALRQAVSGLAGVARLIGGNRSAVRLYRRITA